MAPTTVQSGTSFRTFAEVLDHAARVYGDGCAYVDDGRTLTFSQWRASAEALAAALADRGVGQRDVVALMLPSSADYAIAYAAVLRLGAVVTGLNTRLGAREVDAILGKCRPALVIRDEALGLPPVPSDLPVMTRDELVHACGGPARQAPRWDGAADAPAIIIWTSGTTGSPKGAWFDHAGLAAGVASAGAIGGSRERRLFSTPFAHAGYMAKVWEQVVSGSTLVISPQPWRAQDMARLLVAERINLAGGVPTQWAKLLEVPELQGRDLPDLRVGVSATAPASPELVKAVRERLGCALVVRYAMTESPSITGTDPDDPPEVQSETVGRAQRGMEVRVVDTGGQTSPCRPVDAGKNGEVQVRGGCVMRGYWEDPELTSAAFTADGWLRTGDLGHLDRAGNLVLVGRAKDMYIRGGYNVYPLEVENVLGEHPAVARVSVVGIPAPVIGEIGVAFVVPAAPDEPPTLATLRAHVASRLADYKAPDELRIVDDLPLTSMLKVDKDALRRRLVDSDAR